VTWRASRSVLQPSRSRVLLPWAAVRKYGRRPSSESRIVSRDRGQESKTSEESAGSRGGGSRPGLVRGIGPIALLAVVAGSHAWITHTRAIGIPPLLTSAAPRSACSSTTSLCMINMTPHLHRRRRCSPSEAALEAASHRFRRCRPLGPRGGCGPWPARDMPGKRTPFDTRTIVDLRDGLAVLRLTSAFCSLIAHRRRKLLSKQKVVE